MQELNELLNDIIYRMREAPGLAMLLFVLVAFLVIVVIAG
jgi:hypothetical protein